MSEQEAFEREVNNFNRGKKLDLAKHHDKSYGTYLFDQTECAWRAYQTAIAYMQEQSEPVAVVSTHYEYGGHGYGSHKTDRLDITNTEYGKQALKSGDKLYTTPQRQQPLKRLSEGKIEELMSGDNGFCSEEFANAIMDEIERINK